MKDDNRPRVVTGDFSKDDKGRADRDRALRDMRESMAWHLEYIAIQAQLTRAKYLALVKEGFTAAEAIELCKGT